MSNPTLAVISGYATKEEAYAMWAQIKGNDELAVVGINIGLGTLKPSEKEVCWIILPTTAMDGIANKGG